MVQTFSHSTCATARLFFLKSLFSEGGKHLVITDSERDIQLMRNFANTILGRDIRFVESISEFWNMTESGDGIFCINTDILETEGKIEYLKRHSLYSIKRGVELPIESVIEQLIEFGYIHSSYVGELGTYKREGSLLTFTDSISGNLIHIEWFDTEIDSIIEIDAKSGNRSFRESVTIKNKEPQKLERVEGKLNEELLEIVHSARCMVHDTEEKIHEPSTTNQVPSTIVIGCDFLPYIEQLRSIATVHFSEFGREDSESLDVAIPDIPHIDVLKEFLYEKRVNPPIIYTKYEKTLRDFLEYNSLSGITVIPVTRIGLESFEFCGKTKNGETEGDKLSESESEQGNRGAVASEFLSPSAPFATFQGGKVEEDFSTSAATFARNDIIIITDDILGEIFVQNRTRKSIAKNLDLLLSLKPGDYVVHREHGIARFHAVVKKTVGSLEREYLELHYAGEDKLFVPLTEIYRVSKYLGNLEPELTSLAGKEWERTMEKADEEIQAIAEDILETSAKRSLAKGRAFGRFPKEEKVFQDAFAYDYTKDQASAIQDIFEDMETPTPMDRLISGDVGFGKTEVAMNAIYKAVLSKMQVAVISPLLVLADEHYETFTDRLGAFGVRVGVMTRMNSEREIKQTLEGLKNGTIDVVVGTHRLLSDDVRFAHLGLLVIDEEHKFGVTHKEKLKKMRAGLDILSLSATPIPRSLNLALSGLKKISILATAPKKKKPIETIITRWNESVIAKAIAYELERGGQVIIVHNRIRGMESIERELNSIINYGLGIIDGKENPSKINHQESRIIITHGQMPGEQIEDRIHAFKKGEYNILLTTTIIENGVNFLSANTIIIIDPEEFGLAQLHQLRGRVGRKDAQGYCYLMYRKPELMKEEKERLITIANNTHLGAGFEIAMRDLEIRGAGDVLGLKQSGKSKDVGLTLYFRMLEEKIEELKDERKKRAWTKIELDISYMIPDEYFLSETDKLNFYREIENIETMEELEEIEKEMEITGGKLGEGLNSSLATCNLFLLLRTRLLLSEYHVAKLSKVGVNYVFDFVEGTDVPKIKSFLERFDRRKQMVLLGIKKIRVETRYYKSVEDFLEELCG